MAAAELYKQDGDYYQGVNKASCGYKLLAAMGWQEGEGLVCTCDVVCCLWSFQLHYQQTLCVIYTKGAQKQGIKSHVKVKKKIDNAGVGKVLLVYQAVVGLIKQACSRHDIFIPYNHRVRRMHEHVTGQTG